MTSYAITSIQQWAPLIQDPSPSVAGQTRALVDKIDQLGKSAISGSDYTSAVNSVYDAYKTRIATVSIDPKISSSLLLRELVKDKLLLSQPSPELCEKVLNRLMDKCCTEEIESFTLALQPKSDTTFEGKIGVIEFAEVNKAVEDKLNTLLLLYPSCSEPKKNEIKKQFSDSLLKRYKPQIDAQIKRLTHPEQEEEEDQLYQSFINDAQKDSAASIAELKQWEATYGDSKQKEGEALLKKGQTLVDENVESVKKHTLDILQALFDYNLPGWKPETGITLAEHADTQIVEINWVSQENKKDFISRVSCYKEALKEVAPSQQALATLLGEKDAFLKEKPEKREALEKKHLKNNQVAQWPASRIYDELGKRKMSLAEQYQELLIFLGDQPPRRVVTPLQVSQGLQDSTSPVVQVAAAVFGLSLLLYGAFIVATTSVNYATASVNYAADTTLVRGISGGLSMAGTAVSVTTQVLSVAGTAVSVTTQVISVVALWLQGQDL